MITFDIKIEWRDFEDSISTDLKEDEFFEEIYWSTIIDDLDFVEMNEQTLPCDFDTYLEKFKQVWTNQDFSSYKSYIITRHSEDKKSVEIDILNYHLDDDFEKFANYIFDQLTN